LTHSKRTKENYENAPLQTFSSSSSPPFFVIQDRQCRNDKMSLRNDEAKAAEAERRKERRKIIPYFD
jgi:hypothetical protein